jgi:hypothetical protein
LLVPASACFCHHKAAPAPCSFRVELGAFADMIAREDLCREGRRAASLDNAWTLAAIIDAARC